MNARRHDESAHISCISMSLERLLLTDRLMTGSARKTMVPFTRLECARLRAAQPAYLDKQASASPFNYLMSSAFRVRLLKDDPIAAHQALVLTRLARRVHWRPVNLTDGQWHNRCYVNTRSVAVLLNLGP